MNRTRWYWIETRKIGEFEEIAYRIKRAESKEEDDGEETGSLREAFRRNGGGGVRIFVSLVLHEESSNEQVYSFRLMGLRLHEGPFIDEKSWIFLVQNNYKLKLKFPFLTFLFSK